MKIFTKIFLSIFCFVVIVIFILSFILIRNQVVYAEQELIKQEKNIGDFLSKQVEIGYLQSQLPYESLSKLTKTDNFLFWWIVRDDGIIYRADKTSFMETRALDYFPEVAKISPNEAVYVDKSGSYGIYLANLKISTSEWKFWFGFSMKGLDTIKKNIIVYSILAFIFSIGILGISLYFIVLFFLKPIKFLSEGVREISKGNLNYVVKIKTTDEIGDLASAFGQMTTELKKNKQELEEYSKSLEERVTERTRELETRGEELKAKSAELERFNKLMVDRELKMVELKKKISDLEQGGEKKV